MVFSFVAFLFALDVVSLACIEGVSVRVHGGVVAAFQEFIDDDFARAADPALADRVRGVLGVCAPDHRPPERHERLCAASEAMVALRQIETLRAENRLFYRPLMWNRTRYTVSMICVTVKSTQDTTRAAV